MTSLFLRIEPHLSEPFERRCEGDSCVLGRSSKADITVPDRFMSRLQARFFREGDAWLVEDLGGRNPTLLNGRPVSGPTRIAAGDLVTISETRVFVQSETEAATPQDVVTPGALFRPASSYIEPPEGGAAELDEGRLRHQRNRLRLINEFHRALSGPISLAELLELVLDRAFADLRPEEGVIFLRRPDGEYVRAAQRRTPESTSEFLYSRSLVREVTEKGLAALVLDASRDERFSTSESILSAGVRSLVAAPLLDPDGCPGMIVLNSRVHVRRFSEDDMEELVSLASVAALRIRNIALAEEVAQRRVLEKELSLARQIQVALLPTELPRIDGYELFAVNVPTRAVSGDLYKVQMRSDDRECVLLLADVSGKGFSASLLTASLEALSAGPIEVGQAPEEICLRLSRRLHARTSGARYATAFVAALEPATGLLRWSNAGHNPALLVEAGGAVRELAATGLPLGMLAFGEYGGEQRALRPGDLVVAYTDGVTEAANPRGEEFGLPRLVELCRREAPRGVERLGVELMRALDEFAAGVPFADDRTLILLRRR